MQDPVKGFVYYNSRPAGWQDREDDRAPPNGGSTFFMCWWVPDTRSRDGSSDDGFLYSSEAKEAERDSVGVGSLGSWVLTCWAPGFWREEWGRWHLGCLQERSTANKLFFNSPKS
jgi:hypothetical protein